MTTTTPNVTVSLVIRGPRSRRPDRAVHASDLGVHDTNLAVHDGDLAVHNAPISVSTWPISLSTFSRSGCPQCSDPRVHDRPMRATGARRVVVLGQPGAGKSTLVDMLTEESLSPRPVIGAMTDQTDWSRLRHVELPVAHDGSVWVDSPGYGTAQHPVDSFLEHIAFRNVDRLVLAYSGKLRDSDDSLLDLLRRRAGRGARKPDVFLVRTQSETLSAHARNVVRDELESRAPAGAKILLVSSCTGQGIDELRRALR